MSKLRGQLWAKILAVILLILCCYGAVISAAASMLAVQGYGVADAFYEDRLCTEPMEELILQYVELVTSDRDEDMLHEFLRTQSKGVSFDVVHLDEDGRDISRLIGADPEASVPVTSITYHLEGDSLIPAKIRSGTPSDMALSEEAVSTESGAPLQTDQAQLLEDPRLLTEELSRQWWDGPREGTYVVTGYLSRHTLDFRNGIFHRNLVLYDMVSPIALMAQPLAVVFGLAALGMLLFLLSAAGHRAGETGIRCSWQDRIPLDVYLVGVFLLLAVIYAIGMDVYYRERHILSDTYSISTWVVVSGIACCCLVAGLLLLAMLMSLATRLKLGKWWRNTVLYKISAAVCRFFACIGRKIRSFVGIVPMTWRAILAVGGFLLLQGLLAVGGGSSGGGPLLVLAILLDAAAVVAAGCFAWQLQQVRQQGKALAEGKMDAKVDTGKLWADVRAHGEDLNAIGEGMNLAVEQKLRSERLKTELITNVSHDIKTPLTSIVNYVDLLKKEELPQTAEEYLNILDRQAKRLKKLTEDLVEASKASTGNVAVRLEPLVVNEIIHQAIGDYDERLTAGKLEVVVNAYQGNVMVLADGRLLWRVLDNLFSNVCKYALAGTRVYVDLNDKGENVKISIKNISRDPLNGQADELLERFVRGDMSRHTEGSGLGLNIASSLMDLMGGSIHLSTDGDLFKAELTVRRIPEDSPKAAVETPIE